MHFVPFASFAVPLVAAAAAAGAVALPVLIHMLSRQRFQVVPWAAVRFLLTAQKKHKRRIDRWLLLALRVLALVLPLLGMIAATDWAEPVWQAIRPGQAQVTATAPRTHHILVLDCSLSMTADDPAGTRFKKAAGQLTDMVRNANPGDGFTLISMAGGAQAVVPGPSNDVDKVALEAENLKPTHGTADYASALTLVADTLARSPRNYPRRQVTVFTDLQRSAWSPTLPKTDAPPPDYWPRILSRADVAVVTVAPEDTDNLTVANVNLSDPLPLVDQPTAVTVLVQNFGKASKQSVRVELAVLRPGSGDTATPVPVGSQSIDVVESGKQASVSFVLDGANRFREAGPHLIQARLTEADGLPADDTRSLAFEVREGLPCLLVNGKPSTDPFSRASEYLQTALDPPKGKAAFANPARPRTVSLNEFNDPAFSDLAAVDCVFLCDVPSVTPAQVARLEAHLKRGGGLVIGLGPNAVANRDRYNELLYADGTGVMPGKILGVKTAADEEGFRLAAEEKAYTVPPLAEFRTDNARGGLISVPFKQYAHLDAPPDGRGRRVLSFTPAKPPVLKPGEQATKPDAAVVEMPRHRGRVVVYTGTFNRDWTDWPVLPSYLPMMHELLRFAATNPDRHTVRSGEPLEEFFPVTTVGLKATVYAPDGGVSDVHILAGDESGVARYPDAHLAGLYRVVGPDKKPHLFAVNVPDSSPGGGSESDLTRIAPKALTDLGANVQVVTDPAEVQVTTSDGGPPVFVPRKWGATVARWFLMLALAAWLVELWYGWRIGPARSGAIGVKSEKVAGGIGRLVWGVIGLLPLLVAGGLLFAVAHEWATNKPLGFLPDSWRDAVAAWLGVPTAGPGEGTRWWLEGTAGGSFARPPKDTGAIGTVFHYIDQAVANRWVQWGAVGVSVLGVLLLYGLESGATDRRRRVILPALLRLAAVGLLGLVALPQLRVVFVQESWPDVVLLLDTSASMATKDRFQDPAVRAKADELLTSVNLPDGDRLRLAQALLTRKDGEWLNQLLTKRQVRLHVYTMAEQARLVAELNEPGDVGAGSAAVSAAAADGESSRLGDAVQGVLKSFRGGSLSAIVAFTDGVVTSGDDLTRAGREAARSNVPLYLVGLGESYDPPDLVLSDLKADDVVVKGDQLVFEARLTAKGPNPPSAVPVVLSERQGEKKVERARQMVTVDPNGKPVPVRLVHAPEEVGEKTFVIEVPVQPGEGETLNNRMERVVLVTDSKRLKVLLLDGQPRYEYRFVKSLLERETEEVRTTRAVELDVLLLDASNGHWTSDKSGERLRGATPTKAQLAEYDVVVFGDVDPAQVPKANQFFNDLADFVKTKGGGLLFVAGEHATPHKLFDTPLAELLPLTQSEGVARTGGPPPTPADQPLTDTYLPKLTPLGRSHPLFRFVPDEDENAKIWEGLKPFYWVSTGWRKKPSAEVLAVHPTKLPEAGDGGANHPIVLQHFVGSGRVVFFAFDETWRWRWRSSEERFNHFWTQAVRTAARSRVTRIELKTDKQTAYRRNEPIRVTVRFPDDQKPPDATTAVKVQVARKPILLPGRTAPIGDTETRTVTLSGVRDPKAGDAPTRVYETLLPRTPEGEYVFTLVEGSPTKPANRPRAEARVLPPPGERDRLEMDRGELTRAAAESRGRFYTLADADSVIDDLPEAERVPLNDPTPLLQVWSHGLLYLLIALLLGCEWWVRRRERLV
jgi:Mg-chelatase subunit ChlD